MQRQQSKKAPKKQSQRAAPRKQSKKRPGVTLQGSMSPSFRRSPIAAAYSYTSHDPTWLHMEGKVSHPELGGGVRIAGRQLLCSITTTAGDSQLFAANGATVLSINDIQLSPDTLNGKLALQARNYDRYVFRKVALEYVSRIPTSQAGSMALAYVGDAVIPTTPTFALVTSMCPCLQTTFYSQSQKVGMLIVDDMKNPRTFFTMLDATDSSSLRQTVQGSIIGVPDVTSIGAVNMGFLYIDYLIDLYQPTLDQGFSLRLTDAESVEVLRVRKENEERKRRLSCDPIEEIAQLQARIRELKGGESSSPVTRC